VLAGFRAFIALDSFPVYVKRKKLCSGFLRFPKVSGRQQDPVLTFTTQRTAVCSAMARGY
jgi:hypothetical protein